MQRHYVKTCLTSHGETPSDAIAKGAFCFAPEKVEMQYWRGYTKLGMAKIEVTFLPMESIIANEIGMLEAEKRAVGAAFSAKVREIEEKIKRLTALENHSQL